VEVLSVTGVLLPGLASARGASAPCPQLPHHPRDAARRQRLCPSAEQRALLYLRGF